MIHILSAKQFDRANLDDLMKRAREMDAIVASGGSNLLDKKILATLFYEPSTRTRLSFETAMLRLGGEIISETDVTFSSQSKGEILADTIRIISGYADVIAIRSKHVGDAKLASEFSAVPVINAGDGSGEHPTQALLDLYTITKDFPEVLTDAPLRVTFVGDLRYGRTVHSLSILLRNFPNISLRFVSPEILALPEEYAREKDMRETKLTDEILATSDVVYTTRVQKERFADLADYDAIKDEFIFDVETVKKMPEKSILMHPLPRVNEIALEIDTLPQARYFEQAKNGIPMRMALIAYCLGK